MFFVSVSDGSTSTVSRTFDITDFVYNEKYYEMNLLFGKVCHPLQVDRGNFSSNVGM